MGGIVWVANLAGVALKLPSWVPWIAIGGSLLLAIIWAFHDLVAERDSLKSSALGPADSRYAALSDLLGHSLTVGAKLSKERERLPLDAWEVHTRHLIGCAYGDGVAAHIFTPAARVQPIKIEKGTSVLAIGVPQPLAEAINSLHALLGRMPTLTIRPAFNPADWKVFDPAAYKAEHALAIRTEGEAERNCP